MTAAVVADCVSWSQFNGAKDNEPKPMSGTLGDLVRLLTTVNEPPAIQDLAKAKRAVPAFSGTTFRKGTTRAAANAESINLLVFDFDNMREEPIPDQFHPKTGRPVLHKVPIENPAHPGDVVTQLERKGVAAVIYDTWSNSPELPKFRVVIPLQRPVPAELWEKAAVWAVKHLGFEEWDASGAIDWPVLIDTARLNFLPCAPAPTVPRAAELEGAPLGIPIEVLPTLQAQDRPKPEWLKRRPEADPVTGEKWWEAFGVDLTTLDLEGMAREKGLVIGRTKKQEGGTKWRCHCPFSDEHTHALDDDCAVIFQTPGCKPAFMCQHSSHAEVGLRELCEWAGTELVQKHAKPPILACEVFADVTAETADPLTDAENWTAEQIQANAGHLAMLTRANPKRLNTLAQSWDMFGICTKTDLDALIYRADLERIGLDVAQMVEDHSLLERADYQFKLATLRRENPPAYLLLADELIAKKVAGKRDLNRMTAAGEGQIKAMNNEKDRHRDGRAVVPHSPSNLVRTVDELETAILAPGPLDPVFSFAGAYVTVRQVKPVTVRQISGGDYPSMAIVSHYDVHGMLERITRSVRLEGVDTKTGAPKPIPVPAELVRMLLSRRGGSAPPLTGIIEAPTIRQDGTILDREGYDTKTGLLAIFNGQTFPEIPRRPGKKVAQDALRFLEDEVFAEFPFAEDLDRTVASSALITGLVRHALGIAPAFMFSAPAQSTGKTALAGVVAQGAYGRPPAVTSWPENEAEMAKFILAALREGQRAITFDNLRDGCVVNSSQFAAAITSEQFTARILGLSDTATVPTSVLWMLTGNNVHLAGDMPTRILKLYLDSKEERPDRRAFTRDLDSWVAEHRPRIVEAGLTIVRAYVSAGYPKAADSATRFPAWDRMVRLPLIYAGGPDVADKFTDAYSDDPVLLAWSEVLEAWFDLFGNQPMSLSDVREHLYPSGWASGASEDLKAARLREAIKSTATNQKSTGFDASSLGKKLLTYENRALGNKKLSKFQDTHNKVYLWKVDRI